MMELCVLVWTIFLTMRMTKVITYAYWVGYYFSVVACGALFSEDDSTLYDDVPNIAEESATLTTLADGSKYQDYTYAVIVYNNNLYNPSVGWPTLTVKYNGLVKQTLAIPRYAAGGPNLNYGGAGLFRNYYFFGCFRPQLGFVDTRGAGFHDSTVGGATDTAVLNGLGIFSAGLCQATLGMASGYGFNPHKQSGSGDESYQLQGEKLVTFLIVPRVCAALAAERSVYYYFGSFFFFIRILGFQPTPVIPLYLPEH
jgi:hypothetical protein